jgi:hypothetical protein
MTDTGFLSLTYTPSTSGAWDKWQKAEGKRLKVKL